VLRECGTALRSLMMSVNSVTDVHLSVLADHDVALDDDSFVASVRPKTRSDCADGPRPCPFISCRHHLYSAVNRSALLRREYPEIDALVESCTLDIANEGGVTLERVAEILGLTRERVRQLERKALRRVQKAVRLHVKDNSLDDWSEGRQAREGASAGNVADGDVRPPPADTTSSDDDDADDDDAITVQGSIWDLSLEETHERTSAASNSMYRAYIEGSIAHGFENVDERFAKQLEATENLLDAARDQKVTMTNDKKTGGGDISTRVRALITGGATSTAELVEKLGAGERTRVNSTIQNMKKRSELKSTGWGRFALADKIVTSSPTKKPEKKMPRELVMAAVHNDKNSIADIMAATRLNNGTVRYVLRALVVEKMLQAVGSTHSRRYYLPGEAPRVAAPHPMGPGRKAKLDKPRAAQAHKSNGASVVAHVTSSVGSTGIIQELEQLIKERRAEIARLEDALAILKGKYRDAASLRGDLRHSTMT